MREGQGGEWQSSVEITDSWNSRLVLKDGGMKGRESVVRPSPLLHRVLSIS